MAGKIGACVGAGSMKSAKWRQERGRRQGESTEKGERPSRKGMKEQSKGAGGRLGGRWVSEVQKKKGGKKKGGKKGEKRERREGGKKLKPPLESNRFLGQGCREWKSKSASLDGRVIVLVFSPSFFFPLSHEWNSIVLNSAQVYIYPWPTIVDIVIAISIYRWNLFDCIEMEISLKVIRFVMQNCSFCKK